MTGYKHSSLFVAFDGVQESSVSDIGVRLVTFV
jgi:hypothetical protein